MADRGLPANDYRRTAVHEAGHATVAWFCTAVIRVESATIVSDGVAAGRVVTVIDRNIRGNEWCELVFAMGGVAAEALEFGSGHAREAAGDLASCRAIIDHLRGEPPWPEPKGRTLPWRSLFRSDVSERDAALLTFAFRTATAILMNYRSRSDRLAATLLTHGRVGETEIAAVMGSRIPWIMRGRITRSAEFVMVRPDAVPTKEPTRLWRFLERVVRWTSF